MTNFNDIQAGQILLYKARKIRVGETTVFEWKAVVVESVTRAFYVVEGEKYRKDKNGLAFMKRFYMPGEEGAPLKPTPGEEFDKILHNIEFISGLDLIRTNIAQIKDLDKAAEIGLRLKSILEEIKENL